MDGGGDARRERTGYERAALLRDLERLAEQRLRGGGAETHEHARLDQRDLGFQPRPARGDLGAVRLGVDSPLAARLELEMLDDVGHVDEFAIDASLFERA